ncbi:hypothetical protein [Pseudomonas gorinensis]
MKFPKTMKIRCGRGQAPSYKKQNNLLIVKDYGLQLDDRIFVAGGLFFVASGLAPRWAAQQPQ